MTDDFRLVVRQGPQPGQSFPLEKDSLAVGRDPGNDIVINDPHVSRQHARITQQGGLMVIEDLGSTNGTFVNGMRLTGPHTLADGDVIGLGDAVTLTFYGWPAVTTETMVCRSGVVAPRPAYAAPAPPPAVEEKRGGWRWLWVTCGCLIALGILILLAVAVYLWFAPVEFWQRLFQILGLG